MIKKLNKDGEHYSIQIDAKFVEAMRATTATEFEVELNDGWLSITPVSNCCGNDEFEEALADVHARFGNAMKKLAE